MKEETKWEELGEETLIEMPTVEEERGRENRERAVKWKRK